MQEIIMRLHLIQGNYTLIFREGLVFFIAFHKGIRPHTDYRMGLDHIQRMQIDRDPVVVAHKAQGVILHLLSPFLYRFWQDKRSGKRKQNQQRDYPSIFSSQSKKE